jgi:hypothetical protein
VVGPVPARVKARSPPESGTRVSMVAMMVETPSLCASDGFPHGPEELRRGYPRQGGQNPHVLHHQALVVAYEAIRLFSKQPAAQAVWAM